jgi:asparagine synthase (glutamine-hydrolysing)
VHAYEAWGDTFIEYLEGMFAFILWDNSTQKLVAARDRVGIKPLYFAEIDNGLAFASEAGVLLDLLPERRLEPIALGYYLTLGYIPSPWSIWRNIQKLEAGHVLTWRPGAAIRKTPYWEPPRHVLQQAGDQKEWTSLFQQVVEDHLLSDVPVGLFLSGGLDSSAIAACLRDLNRPTKTITVAFPGSTHDEAPLAETLARYLHFENETISIKARDVDLEAFKEIAKAYDEPQGNTALHTMYAISRMAAKEFKVVLSGDGGDEIFGGYVWHADLNKYEFKMRSRFIRAIMRRLTRSRITPAGTAKAARQFATVSPVNRHAYRVYPSFLPEETEFLLAPMNLEFGDDQMLAPFYRHYEPRLPLKRALQRIDLMTFCSDEVLSKVDRASMAHSLEVRVPFLDRRLIEWALTLPLQPQEDSESKPVLRQYLSTRVPKAILQHPKQGFTLRVLDEFDWDAQIATISSGPLVTEGYFSKEWELLLSAGIPSRNTRIWNLLMLTRWAENWLHPGKSSVQP